MNATPWMSTAAAINTSAVRKNGRRRIRPAPKKGKAGACSHGEWRRRGTQQWKRVSLAAICTIASVAPINRYQDGPPQIGAMCNTPPADVAIFDQIK
jgi:hypothetical protein